MIQTKKTDDIRMNLASHDAVADRLEYMHWLFPDVFTEGLLDIELLRRQLGDVNHTGAERFGLMWAGKAESIRALQIPSHGTLVPTPKESVDFDKSENMIIEGDNLEVLKLLQKSYHGKIKMIYIDPPYNTGGDFIYPDNFKEGLETYLRYSGQATEEGFKSTTNAESNGRYHSNWLNMMYPRLFMAKNLLRDDGVIFVSIDDGEVYNLRSLMNEIFGEENFVAQFVWKSRQSEDTRAKTGVSTDHEYVVCYRRSETGVLRGSEKDLEKFSTPDNDSRGPWRSADLTGLATKNQRPNLHYDLINPKTGINYGCPPKGWRYDPQTMATKILEERIIWPPEPAGRPRHKLFLNEMKSIFKNTSSVINKITTSDGTKEVNQLIGTGVFPFPKPVDLIKLLVAQVTADDDIILDFFAGSGSTGHAVLSANIDDNSQRKFILVQLPEKVDPKSEAAQKGHRTIADITRLRMTRAIESFKGDIISERSEILGFKSFRLSSSNFKLWDATNTPKDVEALAQTLELFADNVLPDRSQEDILYEIILKAGQPLTAKIEKIKVAKQQVFSINDGAMLVCLEDPLEEATLRGMLELKPAVMVALDKAFHGNDQLKTNIKLQAEATGESEQSRVLFKTV